MSVQMNFRPAKDEAGMTWKNPRRLSSVRSRATYSRRRPVSSDLVDKSEVFVAAAVGNLVDTDRFDRPNFPVNHAPAEDPTDSTEDRVPAGSEDGRRFLSTEALGPRGQEDSQAVGRLMFAVGPGNLLDLHP